jgi:hypothetical protein
MDIQKTANPLIETKPSIKEIDKELSDVPSPVPEATKPKQSSSLMIEPAWAGE